MVSKNEAELAVKTLLEYLEGGLSEREGLLKTPKRVIDSWDEVFGGYSQNAEDILEATLRTDRTATDQADSALTKIDRSTYSALSNKLSKGTPSKYFVQRFVEKTVVTLYPTADSTNAAKAAHIYFVKRIQDADSTYTDATDVPFRFVPCMVSGLAFYLSQKFNPQLVQQMKLLYEDELARALSEDGSSTSVHITPKVFYPGT